METFSERYGYIQPSTILIREKMTEEIINSICSTYDLLAQYNNRFYEELEKYLWRFFLNNRLGDFYINRGHYIVATDYLKADYPWYKKMDLIESTLSFLENDNNYKEIFFVDTLNSEFKRLNFAYRIIDGQIVEVTSDIEILSIETALKSPSNGVNEHLQTALKLLSKRPKGEYRNSIKESISAVEAIVREITGENTLNFKKIENKGVIIPSALRISLEKLYGYTNHESTGIRHALMDDSNVPDADEAIFMLVSCSAFINYLNKKKS